MSHDMKAKEIGTNETHLGREKNKQKEIITEPMNIRVFQTKANM